MSKSQKHHLFGKSLSNSKKFYTYCKAQIKKPKGKRNRKDKRR